METQEVENLPKDQTTERFELKPPVTCQKGGHEFTQTSGTTAGCQKCPVGYNIPPGTEIKEGHIYIEGQLVI